MKASLVALVMLATVSWNCVRVEATLRYNFYGYTCPNVENIVFASMKKSFAKDKTVAPGVLRLIFHDCFVRVSIRSYPPYLHFIGTIDLFSCTNIFVLFVVVLQSRS